jgi:hypothetical protein
MNRYIVRIVGQWGISWNERVTATSEVHAKLAAEMRCNQGQEFQHHIAVSVTRIYE